MPELIVQDGHTIKAGGVYHPSGSVVGVSDADEAERLVDRGVASWASDAPQNTEPEQVTGNGDVLPDGYATEHVGGGYYHLFGPDGDLIEGPSKGKWQGEDGAIQAAQVHASGRLET